MVWDSDREPGDRGILDEGAPAPRRSRQPGSGDGRDVTLLALAVGGRGLVDPSEPVLHADDEAFLRGRAAFETIRVYDGRPFRLDAHLDRLAGSAERLALPGVDLVAFRGIIRDALAGSGEPASVLRLYVTPGREGGSNPTALAMVSTLPPDLEERRGAGLGMISVAARDRPRGARRRAVASRRRQVDELRRQHGRGGRGPPS